MTEYCHSARHDPEFIFQKRCTFKSVFFSLAVLGIGEVTSAPAFAQNVNGWCFEPDPCAGLIEIQGNLFDTCETSCALTNPHEVEDLQAWLYQLNCRGDFQGDVQTRVLIEGATPTSNFAFFVTDTETRVLQQCNQIDEEWWSILKVVQLRGPESTRVMFDTMAIQLLSILLAMLIAFRAPQMGANLGSLWYVILLPPVVFAVRGGLAAAATATALTTLLTPPAASILGFEGERIALQFLLLVSAGISLMIGAAITDRQRAFRAVQQSEEHLEQEVKARTRELLEAYEFQQHLIRSIGHDLHQPVQSIQMMLEGLMIEYRESPAVARLAQARDISNTADRFITRVLDYAKRDVGQIQVLAAEFPVQSVFDQLAQAFEPQCKARDIRLDIMPTTLHLTSDTHLLWEALSNLLQNAIRLSTAGQNVGLLTRQKGAHIENCVTDQCVAESGNHGKAGFGLQIVTQIARLLGADFSQKPNCAMLSFPQSATQAIATGR